ncbi:MAG TPA: M48 family metalloprotease [Candidatus Sabulitectum sp.]|nr:M48 family metalloprotease [Candidatus Sabulitectum sp.]
MTALIILSLTAFGLGDVVDIIESDEVGSVVTVYQAFDEANREITESEEHYIGRAVAANILATRTAMFDWAAVEYVNEIGAVIAGFSPRPSTYGGWHFMILNDQGINALSCPGGIVLLNKGLCDLAQNEDELAAIIAHEAAHVVLSHGIRSVEKAKLTSAWTTLGHEGARHLGSQEVQELSDTYGDVVDDITMNLVTRGYSRDSERQADSLAVHILYRAGYDPAALASVLDRMSGVTNRNGPGFWQTHPDPSDRAAWVRSEISGAGLSSPPAAEMETRRLRFTERYTNAGTSQGPGTAEPDRGGATTQGSGGRGEGTTTGRPSTTTGARGGEVTGGGR